MTEVVIVEAVRSPIGRRNGGLSTVHPADLLGTVLTELIDRSGIDPAEVGQVVAGCVSQVGEQSFNIGRTAWLSAGPAPHHRRHHGRHPVRVVAAGHQPRHQPGRLGRGRRGRRLRRRADAPGADRVELVEEAGPRRARSPRRTSPTTSSRPSSRAPSASPTSGASPGPTPTPSASPPSSGPPPAWAEGRFDGQVVAVDAPDLDDEGKPDRHHPPGRARRGPARDQPRGAGQPQAGGPPRRRAHRRQLVADQRRRRRRADDDRREGRRAGPHAAGPGRRHVPGRRRPRADADRPHRRHPAPARAHRHGHRRHRPVRDQRGVRLGRAGLAARGRGRPRAHQPQRRGHRPRPPARRHRRVPRHQGRSTSSSAPTAPPPSSPCAAAAASAPAPSSSASDRRRRGRRPPPCPRARLAARPPPPVVPPEVRHGRRAAPSSRPVALARCPSWRPPPRRWVLAAAVGLAVLVALALALLAVRWRRAPATPTGDPARPSSFGSSTATPWSSAVGGAEESVRLIGIDTPESVARDRPVECFGAEAAQRLAELLPPGTVVRLTRDVEPRDATTGCWPTCSASPTGCSSTPPRSATATRSPRTTRPTPPTAPTSSRPSGPPGPPGAGCGRRAAAPTLRWMAPRPAREGPTPTVTRPPSVASTSMVSLAERLGSPRRRPAADRDRRRPRLEPRRQRRRLRGAARRHRHQRLADGAVPVGPRGGVALPGRGRRASTSPSTPSTTCYRWGPITHAPSLLDGDGGFPRTVADLWDHADLDEVRRELRAQVERAILWGFDVSHLDSHLGAAAGQARVLRRLPRPRRRLRAADAAAQRRPRAQHRLPAAARWPPRRASSSPTTSSGSAPVGSRRAIERLLADLPPGVTEVHVHPAVDTPELRAQTPDWPARVDDHDLRGQRPQPAGPARAGSGAELIGYRELRDLQRAGG